MRGRPLHDGHIPAWVEVRPTPYRSYELMLLEMPIQGGYRVALRDEVEMIGDENSLVGDLLRRYAALLSLPDRSDN